MGRLKQAFIVGVPFYCRRCKEMLSDGQAVCPFCENQATPVDELADHYHQQWKDNRDGL